MEKQNKPTFTLHGEVTEDHAYAILSVLAKIMGDKHGVDLEITRKTGEDRSTSSNLANG
jgi:ABC-type transporter Mla MlaB component